MGPCPREFGRAWVPVQQRAGNRNDWVMFPGEGSNWDRRHFRPDQSWRTDWNAGLEASQSHLRPNQCHDGRAFAIAEHGVPCLPSGVCPDSRASAGMVLGEHRQHHGECHDSRASASAVLGGISHQPSGVCHEVRAVEGTVLGVQHPRLTVCPDDRASGIGGGAPGTSYQVLPPGHQQLHNRGLCDPTVDGGEVEVGDV